MGLLAIWMNKTISRFLWEAIKSSRSRRRTCSELRLSSLNSSTWRGSRSFREYYLTIYIEELISNHVLIIVLVLSLPHFWLNEILVGQDFHVHRCCFIHQLDYPQVLLLEGMDQVKTVVAVIIELNGLSFLVDLSSNEILSNQVHEVRCHDFCLQPGFGTDLIKAKRSVNVT